ncbi:MAG: hypothetical protein FWF92_08635 [Oscillospiraceae bacterium]|nr:hypothetical protein [Oscillospiraceae bacterium]
MENKKVILILFFAAMMIFCFVFVSCQNSSKANDNNAGDTQSPDDNINGDNSDGEDNNGENPQAETTESREAISDDLPEIDYNGYDFRFYTYSNLPGEINLAHDFAPPEEIGEVINDSVHKRNRTIEERFNVNIKAIDSEARDYNNHAAKIKKVIQAGDDVFDVAFAHVIRAANLTLENLMVNLLEVPHFNFNKPWWQKQTNEELTLAGKMFLGSNSMFYLGLGSTKVVYFNKNKIMDYGIDMPYQLVFDGKWTIDKLIEISRNTYEDLNGNGEKDEDDFYGYITVANQNGFLISCDIPVLEKNKDDILKIAVNGEKTTNFVDTIYDWYYNSPGVYMYYKQDDNSWLPKMFSNNQALFAFGRIQDTVTDYRASNVEYGILPQPKYDESQANYRAFSTDEFFMVPTTLEGDALERAGVIIEAMSAEGYKQILPAYYEIALKIKYLQDDESVRILELINDSRTVSFAYVYDNWEGFGHMFSHLFGDKPTHDFTSYYEAGLGSAQKRVDTIINGFTGY